MSHPSIPPPGSPDLGEEFPRLLTSDEVARILRIERRTVIRWAGAGLLTSIRLPGGRYRFREADIRGLVKGVRR